MLDYHRPGTPLWTESAWLLSFDGSSPTIAELREQVRSRLPSLPRLSERVSYSRLPLMRPRWVGDSSFDLDWHVREAALEHSGEEGWLRLVDVLLGTALDRSRPLWQLWLADGGDEDRFALLFHHNHALADGHSALHVLRHLLATTPSRDQSGKRARGAGQRTLRSRLREAAEGARSIFAAARLLYPPAPSVPALNRPLGRRRHALIVALPTRRVTEVATGLGCFPNDVYLTAVAGGLRRWLGGREDASAEVTLQAGIPIKTLGRAERSELGNHFSGIRLPLPLGDIPPVDRLRRIQAETKRISEGRVARGGELMSRVHGLAPRQLLTPLARMEWGPSAINIVISHLSLPGDLRACLDRPLQRLSCWTPLFEDHAISVVAAQGSNGTMTVNLLVEPELVPDARALEVGIQETVDALHTLVAPETSTAIRG
jgi:diacylglycerol O-acyltransferase / wax synthase